MPHRRVQTGRLFKEGLLDGEALKWESGGLRHDLGGGGPSGP